MDGREATGRRRDAHCPDGSCQHGRGGLQPVRTSIGGRTTIPAVRRRVEGSHPPPVGYLVACAPRRCAGHRLRV